MQLFVCLMGTLNMLEHAVTQLIQYALSLHEISKPSGAKHKMNDTNDKVMLNKKTKQNNLRLRLSGGRQPKYH